MNEVFVVELSNRKGQYCNLTLPATDYEMLDALEQLHMEPGENPKWEIIEYTDFQQLLPFLDGKCSLYELNALSRRLGSIDQSQHAAFEGLFQMALQRREGPMSVSDLLTYANSTDCCHVVSEATDDATLGRFYAENGFVPELDDLPDIVFEKLDFAKIGKEMRTSEWGIFTKHGYVVQTAEMEPVTESVNTVPQIPDYAFRLLISRRLFDTDDQPEKSVYLELPATEERIAQALEECGATIWAEVTYEVEDSAIPRQEKDMECGDINQLNELSKVIKRLEAGGELPKFKAVLHAMDCDDVSTAVALAEDLDEYIYEPNKRTAEDVAREDLSYSLCGPTLPLLLPHVDLFAYGMELLSYENAMMTPYGYVASRDGSMLLAPEDTPSQGGMQMQ